MGRTRATRAACAALLVALLGVLAIPLKVAGGASRLRTVGGPEPTSTLPPALPATTAPVAPVLTDDVPASDAYVSADIPVTGIDDAQTATVEAPRALALPAAVSGPQPGTHVKAVVVGINDYPGTDHDLRSAVADARDMTAALGRWGVPMQNVVSLEDQDATAGGVLQALQWLVDSAGPADTAVFFFSGHARNLGLGTEAMVGSDGWLLTDQYLAEKLAPLRARSTWIALSVCYGGGFTELLAPGRILTAAADENSLAYENESFGRSYLGQYLIRLALLQGRAGGPIVQQAVAWAQAYLARDAPDRQLTEIDQSTEPISIDGVHRTSESAPEPLPPPGFSADGEPYPSPPPPVATTTPAPPPTVCRHLLNLLCAG